MDDLGTFKMTYLGETGQMTSRSNGVVGTTWTYDTNMKDRKLISVATAPNGTTYQLTNNPEGAITQIIDSYNSQTLTLGYDSRDRLMSQSASSGNYAFNYDAADNITSFGKPNVTLKVTPNNLNQIATFGGTSLSYYVTGNLAQDATSTYTWDAENRLVGIGYLNNQTLTSRFSYDGLNRRTGIAQSDSGVVTGTLYGWCGLRLCQARNGNSVPIKRYFAEGEATPGQNQYYYYGVDQVGSVRDVLDATSGALVAHYDYAPYGAALGMPTASATDFRYAGLFFHQRSGLYLSRTRALDPSDGHWESRDPLGEAGSINLYSYAGQDPIGIADPAGTGPINAVEDSPTYTSPVYYSSALGQESVWYPQTAESTPPPQVASLYPPLPAGASCAGEAGCGDAPTPTPPFGTSSVPAFDPTCNCTVDMGGYQDPSYSLQGCATCAPRTPQQQLQDLNSLANGMMIYGGGASVIGGDLVGVPAAGAGAVLKFYVDQQTGAGLGNSAADLAGAGGFLGAIGRAIASLF